MRGSQPTDGDRIIYDMMCIAITLTTGSREPGVRANANKTQAFSRGVQTGLEFGRRLSFRGVKKGQETVGCGVVTGGGCDGDGCREGWDRRHLLVNRLTQGCVILLA